MSRAWVAAAAKRVAVRPPPAWCVRRFWPPGFAAPHPDTLVGELNAPVAQEIGPIARPKRILVVPELPKTRSGKIMRRLLRDIAENREVGDVSTLQDTAIMNLINTGLTGTKSD